MGTRVQASTNSLAAFTLFMIIAMFPLSLSAPVIMAWIGSSCLVITFFQLAREAVMRNTGDLANSSLGTKASRHFPCQRSM